MINLRWTVAALISQLLLTVLLLVQRQQPRTQAPTASAAPSMQRVLAPENFGAVGDGKTDNSAALAKLFSAWKQLKPLQSVKLEFAAGKTYAFSHPLIMEGEGSNFYPIVDFNG